jgi:CelD/BcsL family acetyltransferase involved in cellulose biosynthesis
MEASVELRRTAAEGGVIATPEHADVKLLVGEATAPQVDRAARAPVRLRHLAGIAGGARVVRVARTAEQVEALRSAWTSMPSDSLQTDIDYFLWSLAEPQVVRPHVLAVERAGRIEAVLAARVLNRRLPCRIGYATVHAPSVRAICVLHDGLLGSDDPATTAAVVDELLAGLERGEADVVVFRQVELGSPLHRAAEGKAGRATRQHGLRTDLRWEIVLPRTLEQYLRSLSSATRKGFRRTAARLEQTFGERLSIRVFREPDDLDVFLRDIEAVAAKTYQRRLGVGYLGDAAQRARMRMLAAHRWLRASILYVDERPVAFELGEVYRGRFRSLAGGYDTDFAHHRVGAYLLVKTIEDMAVDREIALFDFGHGDAEYKARLSHLGLEEADFLLYARRLRPLWINLVRSVLLQASLAVEAGLRRLSLLNRLKHTRRRRGVGGSRGLRPPVATRP